MQLALVAQARGKYRLAVLEVTTGDITAPVFAQPPLINSDETALSMRVSVNEPATLYWAITYEDISAEYRYQLLGFKASLLSAEQVLTVSSQAESGTATIMLLRVIVELVHRKHDVVDCPKQSHDCFHPERNIGPVCFRYPP